MDDQDYSLPIIRGQRVTLEQWAAFDVWCRTNGDSQAAAEAGGVSKHTFYAWKRTPWFMELFDTFVANKQMDVVRVLHENSEKFTNALMDVADGSYEHHKMAAAAVNSAKTFFEIGKRPLIDKRPLTQINQSTVNNYGTINIAKIKNLSAEQILEWRNTGIVPEEMRES